MKHSILVIEDNLDNQQLVTWILEDDGYDVVCSGTAEEGLKELNSHPYSAVLMDISLPGMDGKEATRCLREEEQFKHLPVIALTAHAIKGETESIYDSGVTELITKPVDEELLLKRLSSLINKH
ncbi:MAG: response regulator [Cellvibrionaceae bacterium]